MIFAIGGGSIVDLGKGIVFQSLADNDHSLLQYLQHTVVQRLQKV